MSRLCLLFAVAVPCLSEASPGCRIYLPQRRADFEVPAGARFLCGFSTPAPLTEVSPGREVLVPAGPCEPEELVGRVGSATRQPADDALGHRAGYLYFSDAGVAWANPSGYAPFARCRLTRERLRIPKDEPFRLREVVPGAVLELTEVERRYGPPYEKCWALPDGVELRPGGLYLWGGWLVRVLEDAPPPSIPPLDVRRGDKGGACAFFFKPQVLVMTGEYSPNLWFRYFVKRADTGEHVIPETIGPHVAFDVDARIEPGVLHVLEYRAFDFAGRESSPQRVRFDR